MKKFTDTYKTSEDLKTKDAKLFESFVERTGLPEELCKQLFENGQYQSLMEQELDDDLKPETSMFSKAFNVFLKELDNAKTSAINELIVSLLTKQSNSNSWNLFKTVMYMLFVKNNIDYTEVNKRIGIDDNLWILVERNRELYESMLFDIQSNKEHKSLFESQRLNIPGFNTDVNEQDTINFYSSLRDVLVSMNRNWDNSIRLETAHTSIVNYLTSEIEFLTNKDSIQTGDKNQIGMIVYQLLDGNLSPMYKSFNSIRDLIVDKQLLVYELMMVVHTYFKQHADIAGYLSAKDTKEVADAYLLLKNLIHSSSKSSSFDQVYADVCNRGKLMLGEENNNDTRDFSNAMLISYQSVQDALLLMKNCTPEFNLKTRGIINNFVTKCLSFALRVNNIRIKISDARLDHKLPV